MVDITGLAFRLTRTVHELEHPEDTAAFIRARARLSVVRRHLTEALAGHPDVHFDPAVHPRDRLGMFIHVLQHLHAGQTVHVPGGWVRRVREEDDHYIFQRGGHPVARGEGSHRVAKDIIHHHDPYLHDPFGFGG